MLPHLALPMMVATGLLAAGAFAADRPAEQSRKLVEILQSDAPLFDKARACQQLGEFGGAEAVPALAALLADEHLSAYARSGLEGIPDPSAAQALRSAVDVLHGNQLAGVIDSLAVLRDPQAVDRLRTLAGDPASGVARQALLALGRIATVESIESLRQTLAGGPDNHRADAAAGCLLAAEERLAHGDTEGACDLYDAVRGSRLPGVYRAAATRGLIVARKDAGVPLLVEQLHSRDPLLRDAALVAIREIPSEALADALNAAAGQAPPGLRVLLLIALADCHNAQSLQVLRTNASSEAAEVRQAALTVLGRIGGAAEAGVLLSALAQPRSDEELDLALGALQRMEAPGVDQQIALTLESVTDTQLRVQLIRLLESRAAATSHGDLLKLAADPEGPVALAALRALKSLAEPGDLPALIALTQGAQQEALRVAAENAVVGTCLRTDQVDRGCEAVLAQLQQAHDPAVKDSWIRILITFGDSRALPAVLGALHDADETVAAHTIEELARWPNPAPMETLLSVMQTDANPAQRERALGTVIALATAAAEERQSPNATVLTWFQQAAQAAKGVEERRRIISGLGRVNDLESFRLLSRYLEDPRLHDEAAVAIVQIAPALTEQDPAALKAALDRIASTVNNADLGAKAKAISASLPKPAS